MFDRIFCLAPFRVQAHNMLCDQRVVRNGRKVASPSHISQRNLYTTLQLHICVPHKIYLSHGDAKKKFLSKIKTNSNDIEQLLAMMFSLSY